MVANLKEYIPEGIRINQITAGHAKGFHEKLKAKGMAKTTIYKRIQLARYVEHHDGPGIRSCPIFPELRPTVTRASEPAGVSGRRIR
ncbi:MAG: hypothetical protein ACK48K_17840 [Planctomycetota bacterium]